MKCLVTGGKGFIGSHVVELLVDEGHEVIVIDNETSVSNEIFYEVPGVAYYKEDMCDSSTHSYYDGVDWVFHLAALAELGRLHMELGDYATAIVLLKRRLDLHHDKYLQLAYEKCFASLQIPNQ